MKKATKRKLIRVKNRIIRISCYIATFTMVLGISALDSEPFTFRPIIIGLGSMLWLVLVYAATEMNKSEREEKRQ